MPLKVKRHKKGKIPSHSNKKRLKQRRNKKVASGQVKVINEAWNNYKSPKCNLESMGLASDPNVAVRNKKSKPEDIGTKQSESKKVKIPKLLEQQAKAPRVRSFKFPDTQARYFSYLIKKYGDDYKAMARDSKNVYQETWKKIRSRIVQFKKLEQYNIFMYGKKKIK